MALVIIGYKRLRLPSLVHECSAVVLVQIVSTEELYCTKAFLLGFQDSASSRLQEL